MHRDSSSRSSAALQGGDRLAVLGQPIGHSRSPRIHSAAYEMLGLNWSYEAIECGETDLESLIAGFGPEWRGLSVTMPLKEEAHRLARVLDPVARESGVVNTLLRLGGDIGWAGFNTDVAGLAAAIGEAQLDATRTIVIGSGATAISAVLAARSLGSERVTVLARNAQAVADLVSRFDGTSEPGSAHQVSVDGAVLVNSGSLQLEQIGQATLVISSLPGPIGAELELPESLTAVPLFDVAYDPWPSPLASRWHAAGGLAYAGLDMLVQQALLQLRIFAGGDPGAVQEREDEVLAAMRQAAAYRD